MNRRALCAIPLVVFLALSCTSPSVTDTTVAGPAVAQPSVAQPSIAAPASTQPVVVTPDHADGVYAPGTQVTWTVRWNSTNPPPTTNPSYTIKRFGLKGIESGSIAFSSDGEAFVKHKLDDADVLLLQVRIDDKVAAAGGAISSPQKIAPSAPRPDDFDAFWSEKIKELAAVPANPQLQRVDVGKPNVEYYKIDMDNIRGSRIHGQLAKPSSGTKFPALLIVQWAGVYGLQKSWVVDRAAEGWLAMNILPHDLPIDESESFYQQQKDGALKNYFQFDNDDREKSYYLRMYLSCYRAAEYLSQRDDWDGRTLVVMGSSQGGQQSLLTAGLHPKITAALANVPAGCDMLGPASGRRGGFPQWYDRVGDKDPVKVHETSRYYDIVNFASRIRCPVLIGVGLIDETCPPAGVFAAANQIRTPKEVVLMPRSGHKNVENSQAPWEEACWKRWLPALREGKPVPPPTPGA